MSFGAYTLADKDGKAIVKERLAIDRAEDASLAICRPGDRSSSSARPDRRGADTYGTAARQVAAARSGRSEPLVPAGCSRRRQAC